MKGFQVKYAELFTLSVEQLFYQNKVCRDYKTEPELDFILQPSLECQKLMNRLDLIVKNASRKGGIIVFARVNGSNFSGDALMRFSAKSSDKLSFWMMLKNPEFLNFNKLSPQQASDHFYHFSNQISDPTALRNDLHLNMDPFGVSDANDTIKKVSEHYRFHHMSMVASGNAKVHHLLTGIEVAATSVINFAGEANITFNLSALPIGKCQLLINGVITEEFYYTGKTATQPLFGVIEVLLSPTIDENYRVIEPDRSISMERPLFKIRFINRQTLWRYTIQLKLNSPLFLEMAELNPAEKVDFINQLNIISNDSTLTFTQTSATDTEFVFVSDNTLALQEKYFSSTSTTQEILSLTIKKYIGNLARETAVKTYLPYPSTSTINTLGLPRIYSDIFITL